MKPKCSTGRAVPALPPCARLPPSTPVAASHDGNPCHDSAIITIPTSAVKSVEDVSAEEQDDFDLLLAAIDEDALFHEERCADLHSILLITVLSSG